MAKEQYEEVYLPGLKVDMSYQRPLREDWVNQIAKNWDDEQVNVLHVSRRSDGDYTVDGNHTANGAMRIGIKYLVARIHTGLTPKEEATLFDKLNSARKSTSFGEKLKARAAAGLEREKTYLDLLDKTGVPYTLTKGSKGKLACHSAMINVYKKTTPHVMERALRVANRAAADRSEFYQVGYFPGLCSTVVMHPEIDDSRLSYVIRKTSSLKIREIADGFKRTIGNEGTYSTTKSYRHAYLFLYNKGLKKGRIEE